MKKGFTLIEILGVMVLLGILALITIPIVNTLVKNSKESALNETVQTLEKAAYNYSVNNALEYSSQTRILQIYELKEKGYIKNEKIINPVTEEELEGCIFYRWDDNYKQYEFDYDEECVLKDLSVTITNVDGKFNDLGWANKEFYVEIKTNGTSYNYCVSNKKCSPNAKVETSEGSALISTESENIYVCAYAMDGKITSEIVCSDLYKLDKTNPTAGTVEFVGEQGENGWYISDVEVVLKDGLDTLSGHKSTTVNKSQITESTTNEKIVVTTTDNADNMATREYTVKMDKTDPTVSISKSVVNNKNVLTATTNTIKSGVTYEWYKDGKVITGATSSSYTTTEAGTYKVMITTGAGVSATSNEITIKSYTITYDLNGVSGTIASQTKIEDLNINIISTVPRREGYAFEGWGISATDKTADYKPGSLYTKNENIKLYAIWKKSLTLVFEGNGATVSSSSISCDIYNAETSCITKTPTITAANGYTKNGFGVSANSTSKALNENTNVTITTSTTGSKYYALQSKTVTITFYKNGAASITPKGGSATTATSLTQTCTMYNTSTTCNITSPTINASSTTPTVLGWNTSANSTSSAWNVNTDKAFSSNASYYAITRKDAVTLTATFNRNNATISKTSAQCTIPASYNGASQGTSCQVTAPTITGPSTTPTVVGFNTSASATTAQVGSGATFSISSNPTYYAITRKDAVTYTIVYSRGAGVSTIGSTSGSCSISATYNGASQGTSCIITLPSITATTGYVASGWYNTSGTKLGNASTNILVSASQTLIAKATANYICSSGTLVQNTGYSPATGGWICVANNPTSTTQCLETTCKTCTYKAKDQSCGYVEEDGGRWCGVYKYERITSYPSLTDVTKDECASRPYIGCETISCSSYKSERYCGRSSCSACTSGERIEQKSDGLYCVSDYTCSYKKAIGCSSFHNACVSLSSFGSKHIEGTDYIKDCKITTNQLKECDVNNANCTECGSYCSNEKTIYSCPSGWSTYSGSDSGLNCYVSATLVG